MSKRHASPLRAERHASVTSGAERHASPLRAERHASVTSGAERHASVTLGVVTEGSAADDLV
ncbi:hypothetical protein Mkiyose1386_24630 [Mycobacterium kiyosense]|uniref:hypothetical protein n=1 Tax=Mycobacterium kiyosense TaxID=2871094 RepID=UPI0021721519|nr:hypothetical protein [Mycobacterium kiyosense]GLD24470.1 hypothetical protein Mkiyose1386_24630 [Mycobacterium kiyosense]